MLLDKLNLLDYLSLTSTYFSLVLFNSAHLKLLMDCIRNIRSDNGRNPRCNCKISGWQCIKYNRAQPCTTLVENSQGDE